MLPRRPLAPLLCLILWASAPVAASPRSGELSEAARWLQGYLRIDTSNPPGNEQRAAAYLAAILQKEGIPSRQVATPQGRTSLWARLAAGGTGSGGSGGRAVLLLHHMDVVPPGPGWTVPPFSGLLKDGLLWGRGAVDDKSLGIAYLAAFVDLKRRHLPLERDVVFLAVADEENGGFQGTGWLLANHPELFQGVEAVLGEGGRTQISGNKLLWWGIEVAQKRPLWLEVTTTGRGGHASGLNPESANHTLIQALARLLARPPRWRVSAASRDYVHALAPLHAQPWRRVLSDIDKVVTESGPKEFLMPGMANLFLDTVQVTVLSGGERINVIPASSTARLDIRLLPDTDGDAFLAEVRRTLGADCGVKVLVTAPPAAPSPAAGRMYAALQKALGREAPLVPTFVPGFTDSRFFRERRVAAYGLSPFALSGDDTRGIHNTDERIAVAELDRGVERMRRILAAYAVAATAATAPPR
jgi:acetylornithine deacetylase/succinyl-diaminopimelate desuccinylase-like protein